MVSPADKTLVIYQDFKHASISTINGFPGVVVVTAKKEYIPIEQFKEIFDLTGKLVEEKQATRLIFDKRKLTVFHQPSMEWYFTEWKEKMFALGLTTHRKILPDNNVFRLSVKIGRDKINSSFPNGKFHEMDIGYAESLDEAIEP